MAIPPFKLSDYGLVILIWLTATSVTNLSLDCTRNLKPATQTRSQTVVSIDLKFSTSNQDLDTRFDVGLTSIRRLRFQIRVVQSAVNISKLLFFYNLYCVFCKSKL